MIAVVEVTLAVGLGIGEQRVELQAVGVFQVLVEARAGGIMAPSIAELLGFVGVIVTVLQLHVIQGRAIVIQIVVLVEATANSARNAATAVVVVFGVPLVGQGHELALVQGT